MKNFYEVIYQLVMESDKDLSKRLPSKVIREEGESGEVREK